MRLTDRDLNKSKRAANANLLRAPRNREETEALAQEVVNQPAEIIARLKKLLGE
jgi:hypothetical protein